MELLQKPQGLCNVWLNYQWNCENGDGSTGMQEFFMRRLRHVMNSWVEILTSESFEDFFLFQH